MNHLFPQICDTVDSQEKMWRSVAQGSGVRYSRIVPDGEWGIVQPAIRYYVSSRFSLQLDIWIHMNLLPANSQSDQVVE